MTNTEKIANAKKRIDELERLIKYWNDSDHDEAKIVNFSKNIENKVAQIVIIKADKLLSIISDLISLRFRILFNL